MKILFLLWCMSPTYEVSPAPATATIFAPLLCLLLTVSYCCYRVHCLSITRCYTPSCTSYSTPPPLPSPPPRAVPMGMGSTRRRPTRPLPRLVFTPTRHFPLVVLSVKYERRRRRQRDPVRITAVATMVIVVILTLTWSSAMRNPTRRIHHPISLYTCVYIVR